MATLAGNDLGVIKTENQTKDSNLFFLPIPYSDSDDAILIDIMGTGRTINISGTYIGTATQLRTFITTIEGIQNGAQSGSAYVGELITTSKTVEIQSFNWRYEEGDTGRISYDLVLLEGTL